MTLPYKIGISILALLAAFACGKYSSTSKPNTVTKTETDTNLKENENKATHEVIVTSKSPDGTVKTTTTIDTNTHLNETKKTDTNTEVTVTQQTAKINVSILGGYDFTKSGSPPLYGLSVNKEFAGPFTVGAWGLTSGVVGLSLGFNF